MTKKQMQQKQELQDTANKQIEIFSVTTITNSCSDKLVKIYKCT